MDFGKLLVEADAVSDWEKHFEELLDHNELPEPEHSSLDRALLPLLLTNFLHEHPEACYFVFDGNMHNLLSFLDEQYQPEQFESRCIAAYLLIIMVEFKGMFLHPHTQLLSRFLREDPESEFVENCQKCFDHLTNEVQKMCDGLTARNKNHFPAGFQLSMFLECERLSSINLFLLVHVHAQHRIYKNFHDQLLKWEHIPVDMTGETAHKRVWFAYKKMMEYFTVEMESYLHKMPKEEFQEDALFEFEHIGFN